MFGRRRIISSKWRTREADDIANLSFISGKTNRQILAKAPKDFLPAYIDTAGAQALHAQCIPTDAALLDVGDYKKFLVERRRLISERLNAFVGATATG